ncbi:MAG TPA: hypothetical protein DCL41_05320, partial [Bdellovibrionales bacterium]|nr:hypothetical protein [Bdellovibrionales bacterium]
SLDSKRLSRNIPLIYTLNAFWALMVILPVVVPFFQSRGLTMAQVFQLQSVFAFSLLVLEVPSGYFADVFGRKTSLLWACLFHGLGFTMLVHSSEFFYFVAAEVVMALAVSLMSGTDVSMIYDSQNALGSSKAPIKMVGRRVFYMQMGETLGGLIGGFLMVFSFQGPIWGQTVVAWLPCFVVLFLTEPPRSGLEGRSHSENFSLVLRTLFVESKLLRRIVLTSMVYGVATLIAVWGFQKYWQELSIPIEYFGYLWAMSNLTVALTGRFAHKIELLLGSSKTLILMCVLPVIGYLGVGFTGSVFGVIFCLCFQMSRGFNAVVIRDALNRRIGGELRATANSISSLGIRAIFVAVGPLFGHLIDVRGVRHSYEMMGWIYVGVFFLMVFPLLTHRQEFQGADEIRRSKNRV